jgi:gamma-glutamylcyclotransferase
MDNHHRIVAAARERDRDAPARLYFGYSTVLDRQAFEDWRGQHGYDDFELPEGAVAQAQDVDLIFDFPSRFWGGRVAGLVDRPGATVYGRLYEIAGPDWAIVEHKEGAVTGMSVPREVTVKVGDRTVQATAFTTRPERASSDGPISAAFVDALVRGAETAGLPADYLERLRGLASGGWR